MESWAGALNDQAWNVSVPRMPSTSNAALLGVDPSRWKTSRKILLGLVLADDAYRRRAVGGRVVGDRHPTVQDVRRHGHG